MTALGRRLQRVAAQRGESFVAAHEPSMWLRGRLDDIRARAGQLVPCPHLLPGMPCALALWPPQRLVCGACGPTLVPAGEDNFTCDRCGTVDPGLRLMTGAATPTMLVVLGLCRDCFGRETGQ